MNKKKIIFFTTGRADFYLLSLIIKKIKKNRSFKTFIVATGSHYQKNRGETYKEIINKGLKINFKVPFNTNSGNKSEIINEVSESFKKNLKILRKVNPDIIVVLGDRFELISVVNTALLLNIPIAHIHGGEVTQGAFDDSIRHSISKLSNIHYVCNKFYKKRLINMGEQPNNIIDVGGLGAELIHNEKVLSKKKIEKSLKFKINKSLIIVNLHPETRNEKVNYLEFFKAIRKIRNKFIIVFTSPNTDPNNSVILKEIKKLSKFSDVYYFSNLGSELYHSLMRFSCILIGNSSSGLLEAPVLKIPSLNLGDRQKGRLLEESVMNCNFNKNEIIKKISILLKRKKQSFKIKYYQNKKASEIIVKSLNNINLKKIKIKKFYDIN